LISCRHRTSGCSRAMNSWSCVSRARNSVDVQVTIFIGDENAVRRSLRCADAGGTGHRHTLRYLRRHTRGRRAFDAARIAQSNEAPPSQYSHAGSITAPRRIAAPMTSELVLDRACCMASGDVPRDERKQLANCDRPMPGPTETQVMGLQDAKCASPGEWPLPGRG
jgi:hypothetical protein